MTDDNKAEESQSTPLDSREPESIEDSERRPIAPWSLKLVDAGVIFGLLTAFFFLAGYARLEGKFGHFYVPALVQEMSSTYVLINALSSILFVFIMALVVAAGAFVYAVLEAKARQRKFNSWFWMLFRPSEPGSIWYYLTFVLFAFVYVFPITVVYAAKNGAKGGARHESGAPVVRIYDTTGAEFEKLAYLAPTDNEHVFFHPGCGEGPPITVRISRKQIGRIATTGEVAESLCHVEEEAAKTPGQGQH